MASIAHASFGREIMPNVEREGGRRLQISPLSVGDYALESLADNGDRLLANNGRWIVSLRVGELVLKRLERYQGMSQETGVRPEHLPNPK